MIATRPALWSAMLILCALASGCASHYMTPGASADLRALFISEDEQEAMTDAPVARELAKRPAANFPATLAILRLQGTGYRSYSTRGWDTGSYSVVTVRDVEEDEDLERLSGMSRVRQVVPLNRLVIGTLHSERDIRNAAARVQADAVIVYTFDTQFSVDTTIPVMGVITLGLFPNQEALVTSTATAAVIDTRTGYVYALAESTADTTQLANAWTAEDAVDQSRRRVEREAFEGLVGELETAWKGVLRANAPRIGGGGAWIGEAHTR